MLKLLKFADKVLTVAIDWLYLKRTKVHLRIAIAASAEQGPYEYPLNPKVIDNRLKEFGLSVEELSSTSAICRASNVDATLKS